MKLLVTGGCGFIGSHVVEQALLAGYEVAVLDRMRPGDTRELNLLGRRWFFSTPNPQVRHFKVDLRDRDRVFGALGAWSPDYVSHHAALIDSPGSCANPHAHFDTNVMGSVNLLDACAAVSSVKRIVFASSAAVYGDLVEGSADEEALPRPETPYGVGKLAVEHLFSAMYPHSGIGCTIFRYPNVYGPRQLGGVVAKFIQAALHDQPLYVQQAAPGTGRPKELGTMRQYAYVEAVARANIAALEQHKIGCDTFNVPGAARNTTEVAERVLAMFPETKSRVCSAPYQPGDVTRSFLIAQRFASEIGGKLTSFDDGMMATAAWWRERIP